MTRLFVAIDLPETVKDNLTDLQQFNIPGARWTRRNQMHITLHFIGEVSEQTLEATRDALTMVRADDFDLTLADVGYFPPKGKIRVLWTGVQSHPGLMALHEKTGTALATTGYHVEKRPYKPHITLARFRRAPSAEPVSVFMQAHQDFVLEPFPVRQFTLYSSQLSSEGAIYRAIQTFSLVNPGDRDDG